MDKIIDIGNDEDAVVNFDEKIVSFMRYGSIVSLRTISFRSLTKIYRAAQGLPEKK